MSAGKTESIKNQTTRFAKVVLSLALLVVAVAGAIMYQESKPNSSNYAASTAATHTGADTQAAQPFMHEEPFSRAGGVSSTSLKAAPTKSAPSKVAAQTRAQAYSAAERQFMLERIDHSVVKQHATNHDSDLPGASIAAY